jgi:Erv1 / Alr family
MGCGCGKRKGPVILIGADIADGNPDTWGPPLWAILHIIAERIGNGGMDADQARDMAIIINLLPSILPCATCQSHMRTYLGLTPFVLSGLVGAPLQTYVRTWLLQFHNAVRTSKGQPIEITTLDQLTTLYGTEKIQSCQIQAVMSNVIYGVRSGLVKMDVWKRWNGIFQRLKVMTGA